MVSDFDFYESSGGWLFAVVRKWGVNLVALEPLPPEHLAGKKFDWGECTTAMKELAVGLKPGPIAFISIGEKFAAFLNSHGFFNLQIGVEPWVNLSNFLPTGNRGKGIRAAKNQAVRWGVSVQAIYPHQIIQNESLRTQVQDLENEFHHQTLIDLRGFLLKTDPWKLADERRFFLARNSSGRVIGVMIATPIGNTEGWYLEDMWISAQAPRGTGELLTLESMAFLHSKGAERVSLGLVPLVSIQSNFNTPEVIGHHKPRLFLQVTHAMAAVFKRFYNAEGLILFRKRFHVAYWAPSFISVQGKTSWSWFRVVCALVAVHKPTFVFWRASRSIPSSQNTLVSDRRAA